MNILYAAHSGLRYLVLLAGLVAIAYFVYGLATKQSAGRATRIVGSSFVGLLDTQVLLGIVLLTMFPFYPALIGHIVMMVAAAAVAHVAMVMNRRRATPGFVLPLVGVGGALLLILGGIMAIGRGPFTSTVG
jgi:hypothetical protein